MTTLIETITSIKHKFEIHKNAKGYEYAIKFKLRGKKGRIFRGYGDTLRNCIDREVSYEIKEHKRWEQIFEENKIARTKLFSELNLGDIIQCNWGATIDAVKFYKLVDKKGKATLILQEIGETVTARDCMVGTTVPNVNVLKGHPFKAVFNKFDGDCFKIKDLPHSSAKKWDGTQKYYNHAD